MSKKSSSDDLGDSNETTEATLTALTNADQRVRQRRDARQPVRRQTGQAIEKGS